MDTVCLVLIGNECGVGAQRGTIRGGGAQRTRPRRSAAAGGSGGDQAQFGRNPEEGKPGICLNIHNGDIEARELYFLSNCVMYGMQWP